MPLHYGKIFAIIALLTIVAFVLWQLWIGLFAGETFDEKAIAPHAEAPKALASQEPWAVRSRIMVFGVGGQVRQPMAEPTSCILILNDEGNGIFHFGMKITTVTDSSRLSPRREFDTF
jgi:hypothetical protein